MGVKKSRALRDNPLPWASIDAYPEWIAALLSNYKRVAAASATADGACSCEERARARRALEKTLLPTPLRTAPIKYRNCAALAPNLCRSAGGSTAQLRSK